MMCVRGLGLILQKSSQDPARTSWFQSFKMQAYQGLDEQAGGKLFYLYFFLGVVSKTNTFAPSYANTFLVVVCALDNHTKIFLCLDLNI